MRYIYFLLFFTMALTSCKKEELQVINDLNIALDTPINEETLSESGGLSSSAVQAKNWVLQMQQPSGLLESAENTDFVSLYDNALATIFFIHEDERSKAEEILDFYHGKIETELLPNGGFYQFRNTKGNEGERVWMGDNAWLLIALNHYEDKYSSSKYNILSQKLENWLRSLQLENGALLGGTNANGSDIPLVTEGMITAFNAIKGFDDFHKNILSFLESERWDATNQILMAWPENPSYAYALDLHSLGSSIFQDFPEQILSQADRYATQQEMTINGEQIFGYCFDEDKDVIWLEGTAQMAVAFNSTSNKEISNAIIQDLEKSFINSATIPNAKGIPYTSNHGTSYGTSILWDHADIAPALSSTIWYIFAKSNFNPLSLGKEKEIPEVYQFWNNNAVN